MIEKNVIGREYIVYILLRIKEEEKIRKIHIYKVFGNLVTW
jgi:hypothetical protein